MKNKIKIALTLIVVLFGLLIIVSTIQAAARTPKVSKIYVVQIRGTDIGEMRMVPDIDGDGKDDEANCFDVELVDLVTNKVIGTATDCLANVTMVGDGIALIGTTYFNFEEGTIVSRGRTTVQPVTHDYKGITHISGASPSGENDILNGTGIFEGATGSVRLSGLVDMSKAMSENKMTFDCIFVITLD